MKSFFLKFALLYQLSNGNHYFSVLVDELKDSFHILFFRLTNEAFFDMGISENVKLREQAKYIYKKEGISFEISINGGKAKFFDKVRSPISSSTGFGMVLNS